MLISVHIPKTAGTSFKLSLIQHYGSAILLDYKDKPINTPPIERNRHVITSSLTNAERDFGEIQCIHGHMMPAKYLLLDTKNPQTFVTWLRNPVERVISHYYFWQRRQKPDSPPLYKRVIEEKWSLERFCLSEEMRNLYKQFLWGFPVIKFDFIGITEHYDEDFRYFTTRYLQKKLPIIRTNVNTGRKGRYTADKSFRREVEEFHHDDMELYHLALKLRDERNHNFRHQFKDILKKAPGLLLKR